jgi:flagellum-specific peptidoglycan hydrolase FlgJ
MTVTDRMSLYSMSPHLPVIPIDIILGAQASQRKWGVPASVTIAQWADESGYGQFMPAGSNNPFGIKATPGQPFVEVETTEIIKGVSHRVLAKFAKYPSIAAAFDAHGRLLGTNRAYRSAKSFIKNPNAYAVAIGHVYATNPHYGRTLIALMEALNLYQYDIK